MSAKEELPNKLLVEGNDDKHVVFALRDKFDVAKNFTVVDCKGIERLIEGIPARLKASDADRLGIIVDADVEIINRWTSIKNILTAKGFDVPVDLPKHGLIVINGQGFKVGVWIMPNNTTGGMLEDFISFLVPKGDQLFTVASETLQLIEQKKLNKFTTGHRSKALIHTWLAWQEEPGTPLGLSITKKYLTTDDDTCKRFIDWMNTLFNS